MISELRSLAIAAAILAAIGAPVVWLVMDNQAKAQRIEELRTEAKTERAEWKAQLVTASERERVRVVYRDTFQEIESHGPTPQICVDDPRIRAAFDGIERLHPNSVRASARGTSSAVRAPRDRAG